MRDKTEEDKRLTAHYSKERDWLKWGPYLSERQWGTVREDYSANGDAWNYLPHDHARSRTYRWGEDGIAGISDRYCNICFALTLWNGKDPILKERLFGLSGPEGNHGEDVKELYYYLENTPSHSYMKHLYKYPQNEYPYRQLVSENQKRGKHETEYELLDTGIFDNDEYFDVYTEYAKGAEEDVLIKITIANRGPIKAELSVLPTLWIRNYWSFLGMNEKPVIKKAGDTGVANVTIDHEYVGRYRMYFDQPLKYLFTENETNVERIFNGTNDHPYKKDLFHRAVINNDFELAEKKNEGTKFSPLYQLEIEPGETHTIKLRLTDTEHASPLDQGFESIFSKREKESQEFLESVTAKSSPEQREIQKQAFAGLLWTKQYYNYEIEQWLKGDPGTSPPKERLYGRNSSWTTFRNHDILSMPDAWEYPWFAAWDSAFHCVTFSMIDHEFAKRQLLLFTKEWYMAANGQIPAYEWNFSDVNPPVQAWAAIQIYQMEQRKTGKGDLSFLKRMFNKLALNFTWWVNQEDSLNNNVFEGGFLGLDNIGVFDRSNGIPGGGILEQVDGTSWMALYCLNMLEMAIEIAIDDPTFEDMCIKYFGHFCFITEALNKISEDSLGSWDGQEGFFYDTLILPSKQKIPIKVRSISGLLSLTAVLNIRKESLDQLPRFRSSMEWYRKYRLENRKYQILEEYRTDDDVLLSLVPRERLNVLIQCVLNESEFLGDYGIRSLSKIHERPYTVQINGGSYSISYENAESMTDLFGGNSNWRGPIWMPMNYLFISTFKEYHNYFGDKLKYAYPSGSDNFLNLKEIAFEISKRLIAIFAKDAEGNRPVNALHRQKYADPHFRELILFYEYFDGNNGRGVGASHQTGWTALVANLIEETNR
ncbi:MGH1-like glycoside hydrolase domain-containing protein [Pseudozobellia thermophila]|uniref:mannosyl-oligosaccharide glucosidase n=1 Tax=Pseudozobellia thermophila TaxID=192903 RepID=A0A1M6C7E7_9FLAO|nr:glucosidase [Pseudozobellia thermophila]SHI56919.1 Glycosyl hydrolase family 63 C-terminal domain-containing protein [Pseudozobellia thermophila]